jgi:cellulose synthase/poly-beta-1,6-N-acetylglucosamine synthase-like glycosyltransferase
MHHKNRVPARTHGPTATVAQSRQKQLARGDPTATVVTSELASLDLPFVLFCFVLCLVSLAWAWQELVKGECERWATEEGINVKYETRKDRAGYKAGNLKEGMRHAYVRACEFVAMFDADFQPPPDFLVRTVPFLVHNPSLALVQTRWKFGESVSLSRARALAVATAFLCVFCTDNNDNDRALSV